jgi:hypothetical protein
LSAVGDSVSRRLKLWRAAPPKVLYGGQVSGRRLSAKADKFAILLSNGVDPVKFIKIW